MGLGDDVTLDELEHDAEPILARMRATEPVCWVPALDMWFVTRWYDVETIEADPATFTAATNPSFLARALGPNMLTLDPPECTRTQDAMRPSFQPRGIAGRFVADRLPAMADHFIDQFATPLAAGQSIDLMTAYAAPLSAGALADVLGLGDHGADTVWRWCQGICTDIANFENDPAKAAIGSAAKAELGEAIVARLDEIRSAPPSTGDDGDGHHALADFLAAAPDGGPLTTDEIINNVRLMISGGINEPRDGIGLVVWTLLSRPDLLDRVTDVPDKFPKLVEEVFRRYSPVGTVTRQATRDVELAGVSIKQGQLVSGILRSVNLDESRYANPTEIDLDRSERGHAAFATGFHRCIGEWLGRQEVRVGAKRLLERFDQLTLAEPVELTGFEFRGPKSLLVSG